MFIVPLSPISPISRRSTELSRLLDQTFDRFFQGQPTFAGDVQSPLLDVVETAQGWTLTLDLPGFAKEDVKVSIEGRQVAIEAQARSEESANEGDRFVLRERRSGRWARSLILPAEVDQTASSAKMDRGVLTLTLARRGAPGATHLTIN